MSRGVYVINRGLETRTLKSGKTRHTIRIDATPMVIDQDTKRLGKPVAEQIANHYRTRINGITEMASPGTLKARKAEEKAFIEGKSWAMKRFAGGRIGPMAPNQTDFKFKNSGRFAKSITANASSDNAWRINVAANRLNDAIIGAAAVQRIWNELVRLIPEFGNAALLMENQILKRTIQHVAKERIKVGKMTSKDLTPFEAFRLLHIGRSGTDEQRNRLSALPRPIALA